MAEGGVKERWKDSGETERCMWRKHGVPAQVSACLALPGAHGLLESSILGVLLAHWALSGSCLFFFPSLWKHILSILMSFSFSRGSLCEGNCIVMSKSPMGFPSTVNKSQYGRLLL